MALDISDELSLIEEYNQWVAVRKSAVMDTTPDEFMRDRVKEVALDRIEQALDYIAKNEQPEYQKQIDDIKAILEGAHVEPSGTDSTEPTEEPEVVANEWTIPEQGFEDPY